MENYDSKGFQDLKTIEKPQNIDKQMQILDLQLLMNDLKKRIDINTAETEHCKKELKICKTKLAEIIGTENEKTNN